MLGVCVHFLDWLDSLEYVWGKVEYERRSHKSGVGLLKRDGMFFGGGWMGVVLNNGKICADSYAHS